MEIRLSSKQMDLTPAIEEYVSKKLDKLDRFFDRIHHVEVVIEKAKNGYALEIITNVAQPNLSAASAIVLVPMTLFLIASRAWVSSMGTCL